MSNSYEVIILARMGEIALKGLNRGKFEGRLISNVQYRLRPFGEFRVFQSQSRFWIEPKNPEKKNFLEDPVWADEVLQAVVQVFGLVSASLVWRFSGGMDEICEMAVRFSKDLVASDGAASFKIESKRGNKNFPLQSPEISALVGGAVLEAIPALRVDVTKPDFVLYVEIRDEIYIYSKKVMGHRGLPVGSAGKGMLLLSGGIDSPVAGYMMASRGMVIEAVYFHAYPYTSDQAKEKVVELARIIGRFSGRLRLHVVNFTPAQLDMYKNSPQDMLTITMRRVMFLVAERLAEKTGCKALITGESLGQVASQTLEAIYVTNSVVKMPVFRPLIGMDKEETTILSRKIGAFETSILPFEDCCTVFVAKHPKTHPLPSHAVMAEENLNIDEMVEAALLDIEVIDV